MYISLFLDSKLYSTDLYVSPFASIAVLIAVALCTKFWNWEVWFLKFYSFFSRWFWLFWVPWISLRILVSPGSFLQEISWNFDGDCIDSIAPFREFWHVRILSLLNQERGMFSHLFRSLFLSTMLYSFQSIRFILLLLLIYKCFILFNVIINGVF